jgi:transcriptional regulator of arginine metabolism
MPGQGVVGGAAAPATKAARHAKITGILALSDTPVRSQDELADRLAAVGVRVTQATLSRDLDELGAVRLRGADGTLVYALPPDHPGLRPTAATDETPAVSTGGALAGLPVASIAALAKVATDLLLSAEASGNLVVVRTPPGAAMLMASMIDRTGISRVLGTVAGDDTVLVVARDPSGGDELAQTLLRLAERRIRTAHGAVHQPEERNGRGT